MKMSSTVKDYIAEEVRTKIEPRYAEELRMANEFYNEWKDYFEIALSKAQEVYRQAIKEFINQHPDKITYSEQQEDILCRKYYYDTSYSFINSPSDVKNRMREEINKKTKEILVTMELGGTKAELKKLLEEI